jgi:hypothetical protein
MLNELHRERGFSLVITGGAGGADQFALLWALRRGVETAIFHADWKLGRKAGQIRNARMLKDGKPDVVIAFRSSRGTADTVARARAAGVEVIEVHKGAVARWCSRSAPDII